jgi:hypothetical protein
VKKVQSLPTVNDFKTEIETLKREAKEVEKEHIDIVSLELHKRLGFSTRNHRMASCCSAMYQMMLTEKGDQIISAPPKGKGSTLKIRYFLK